MSTVNFKIVSLVPRSLWSMALADIKRQANCPPCNGYECRIKQPRVQCAALIAPCVTASFEGRGRKARVTKEMLEPYLENLSLSGVFRMC